MLWLLIILWLFGVGFGYVAASFSVHTSGKLRIDKSDPEGPYMFLELNADPSTIERKKYVTLEIDATSYISQ
jgi:hypothetical protein